MSSFIEQVAECAENAVSLSETRGGDELDYSEASLKLLDEMLVEASEWISEMTPAQVDILVQDFGCYILEVGRRIYGGRYLWHEGREQPVLVVGEPDARIAMLTMDHVRGRLSGDSADAIPFFFAGFAQRAKNPTPGTDVLIV
ncbi:hypothetical protein [Tuwongella immobilis]|uniref:Uncharacterized protein n=1 Tax=Tuwongella immobilis TaxID=692036 RepID=A0A6C2YMB1_9BACT|nr:hypothetical protein [Tuwongella immobilis]VIP02730.1 Uncharacterized protein OS=Gilliamella apicola GN=GAPWKB11_1351 PE=4 SV=1 [Tuwongella immobilis]VTS02280.1 Uncharacterized protein OS=Gilliamella apicola GN=GAPWKB11_1351 PE=4 SV=1 [Tuwongella immobilis]